ncbi:3'-5' exonuclease [Streptacidiphilus sp. MAP5-52]|uniref:3'-5' exonuclease n=1 Tax=Streptacidiphilus sp. MAP5-52 TaxID=3156267 RepID=UPI003511B3FB
MAKKHPGYGPVQLGREVGLAQWQIERGQRCGLVPAPEQGGRWSEAQCEQVREQVPAIVEDLGEHPGLGASRLAEQLGRQLELEVWSSDVEALVERGLVEPVGDYKGFDLYDTRLFTPEAFAHAEVLTEVVAERQRWLQSSLPPHEAAARCGWSPTEFERAARTEQVEAGRFGRWALVDVERLAGNEDLAGALAADRLLGPDQAAQYMEIRRRDLDYCLEAGWLRPYSHRELKVGRYKRVEMALYRTGDLDALKELPGVDWEAVRAVKPGMPSPLREFAKLGPRRADLVHGFTDLLNEQFGVLAWSSFWNSRDRWTIDWLPNEAGEPSREQVRELFNAEPVRAAFTKKVTLLSEATEVVHDALRFLAPGGGVVIDTETTDLFGAVVEVAVVDCASGEVLLDTLVNPGDVAITPEAQEIHGITMEMVTAEGVPSFDQVLPRLLEVTAGRTVLAYNESYDRTVIREDCRRYGLQAGRLRERSTWWCLMAARSEWEGHDRSLALGGGHRAAGDALAALALLHQLAEPPAWLRSRLVGPQAEAEQEVASCRS